MKFCQLLLTTTTFLFSTYVNSAVIQYDEAIDGDLTRDITGLGVYIGSVDVGVNTISGTESSNPSIPLSRDSDTSSFTVTAGNQIDSIFINYDFTGIYAPRVFLQKIIGPDDYGLIEIETILGFYLGTNLDIHAPDVPIYFTHNNYIADQTDILSFFNSAPLTEGQYQLAGSGGFVGTETMNELNTLDYTWSMNVSAVPVPAAVWLFLSGLVGLLGYSRRYKLQKVKIKIL